MPLSSLACVLGLLLAISSAPAKTDELVPRARELLELGTEAYDRGDFAAAIAAFEAGYAVQPAPVFLYTWAQAARYMDDCETAVELYDRFLATDPPPQQRAAAQEYRAKCAPGEPPAAAVLPTPPPSVRPSTIQPETPTAPRVPPEPLETPPRVDKVGTSLVTIGVLLAGAGLGLTAAGGVAVRAEADAKVYEDFRDHRRRKLAFLGSGIPLAGVGVALLVGGVVSLVQHRRATRRERAIVRMR
jgi:tetratricopeptide (TPR) repeat protein